MTTAAHAEPEPLEVEPILRVVDPDAPPAELTVEELGSRIVGMAGRLAAATCEWLLLIAGFDSREGCAAFALPSTARWLSHYAGIAQRTAVEHVRVARALTKFPDLATGMRSGRLSYSHVRAISRLAHEGEQRLVSDLIEVAEHGTVGQLETMVRGLRTVEQSESDAAAREHVTSRWTSESMWQLSAKLDPERGALVDAALDAVCRAEGVSRPDALVRLAEIALAALNDAARPRDLRGDERAAVVIHVDASAARSPERAAARPLGHIEDGPGLPSAVIERLMCEGRIRTAVHGAGGEVTDIGRSRRLVSAKQFHILKLRQGGRCGFPGCRSRRRLEAHHVEHWIRGGPTTLPNLVLLCEWHHHAHHRGEFTVERSRAGVRFVRRDGRDFAVRPDPADHVASARLPGGGAGPPTAPAGQRLARRWAIDVLAGRRERAG